MSKKEREGEEEVSRKRNRRRDRRMGGERKELDDS